MGQTCCLLALFRQKKRLAPHELPTRHQPSYLERSWRFVEAKPIQSREPYSYRESALACLSFVVLPWISRRSPRPNVAFSYSNCGAVSDFIDQLKGVVGSIPCWLFLGSFEEHDGEKVTGLVACTQTFSVTNL